MKISKYEVTKFIFSGIEHFDPIQVYVEDWGDGQGKLVITCAVDAWSYYWGSMGEGYTMVSFFLEASTDYLAKKFMIGKTRTEEDIEAFKVLLRKNLCEMRRQRQFQRTPARDYWNLIDEIERTCEIMPEDIRGTVEMLAGNDWYMDIPSKPNDAYEFLCEVIQHAKTGFILYHTETPDEKVTYKGTERNWVVGK